MQNCDDSRKAGSALGGFHWMLSTLGSTSLSFGTISMGSFVFTHGPYFRTLHTMANNKNDISDSLWYRERDVWM